MAPHIRVRTIRGRVATYSHTVRWMLRTVFAAAQSWYCLFLCKRRRFWYSDRLTHEKSAAKRWNKGAHSVGSLLLFATAAAAG